MLGIRPEARLGLKRKGSAQVVQLAARTAENPSSEPAPALQRSAPPLHARSRAPHWLGTAAALAAVVGAVAVVAPAHAAPPVSNGPHAVPAAAAPAPARARYPLNCDGLPITIEQSVSADLTGNGDIATVVAARCVSGAGTPPDGLYLLQSGAGGRPRIAAELIRPGEQLSVRSLSVRSNGDITAAVDGYSSPSVPRCCADVHETLTWTPHNGGWIRTVSFPAESA